MSTTFPGTTIEVTALKKGGSRQLFDGIFATGGVTLSQVSLMTGVEPYVVQNWVKRGFLTSPVKRVYSKDQFARIILINMLKESLQIDVICGLIRIISGNPRTESDDLIGNAELYHVYVDMIAEREINITDEKSVAELADGAVAELEERSAGDRKKLSRILQVMLYAHSASALRKKSEEALSSLL